MHIKVRLRNGDEFVLILEDAEADPATVFAELAAGRSQALRGWVPVRPSGPGDKQTVVQGEEIVEIRLVDDAG